MRKIILLFLFFISVSVSTAQQSPQEITFNFFETYKNKGASMALDQLYSTNPWMSRSTDAITNVKSQLEGLNEDYVGKYHGYEKLNEKLLGTSYMLLSYMVKFDRQPIRFIFHYYKPKDKWVIYLFKFDAAIDDEMNEAAKLYYENL
ncbi:hypothetical protein SAMN04487906_1501 [Zhouia amylolytica]|uniref:DUF3887 domain-containing protein n=2 Tax=Zhouia amylolytica TaxID=376730 RepID=W2UN73_9FLAO|nr:hypothetical protein [Zhouia amylolytica]ETN94757.1 hypothetical protein P278_27000 [Zhouia amylolytica AD3]MCQ0110940.1 hypothetical protein [Zhouia amylolytica]SFS73986.1 hypothetical protein SAMN04487906_1501 [Zhouia amylolytica]